MIPFFIKFILVIISMALCDMCWAKYTIYVTEKKAVKSAIWSVLIMVCGMVTVIGYMEDKRLIPAALIGAFIGTYLTVKKAKCK